MRPSLRTSMMRSPSLSHSRLEESDAEKSAHICVKYARLSVMLQCFGGWFLGHVIPGVKIEPRGKHNLGDEKHVRTIACNIVESMASKQDTVGTAAGKVGVSEDSCLRQICCCATGVSVSDYVSKNELAAASQR
eukprot:6491540-Amphidinium_carterae.2